MKRSYDYEVIIIGAGMAGLAAGYELARRGKQVLVLEKNPRPGGRVCTISFDGIPVDAGAQFLASFYKQTLRLVKELGLQSRLTTIPGRSAVLRKGHLYRLWPDLRMIFTQLIPVASKLRVLRLIPELVRHWRKLDLASWHKAYPLDGYSLANYAQKKLDRDLLEYVIQPPLSGLIYWTPEQTSQAVLFLMIKAARNMRLYTLRGSLSLLSDALAKGQAIWYEAQVQKVSFLPAGGFQVQLRKGGQDLVLSAGRVVCAVPAPQVPALFPGLDEEQRRFFQEIKYTSNAVAILGLERRLPPEYYGVLFPRLEAQSLATAAVQSAKIQGGIPPGRDILTLYPSGPAGKELIGAPDEQVYHSLLDELRRLAPAYDPGDDLQYGGVYRWEYATPIFDVGHFQRLHDFALKRIERGQLNFAGDYLGGPFVEGAIQSGLEASRRLLASGE